MAFFWNLTPQMVCNVTDIPSNYQVLVAPPLAWSVVLERIADASEGLTTGRHRADLGELHGPAFPQTQDTYISGTPGKTGRDFTIVQGTCKDDWVSPELPVASGLFWGSSTSGDAFEGYSTATTPQIEDAMLVVNRGYTPASLSDPSTLNTYCYIHLAYNPDNAGATEQNPGTPDYRIAIEWGTPIALDYFDGVNWNRVQQLRAMGNAEWVLRARQNEVVFNIQPQQLLLNDSVERPAQLSIELYYGNWMRHSPTMQDPQTGAIVPAPLPTPGNIRIIGQNGWAALEYRNYRYGGLMAQSQVLDTGSMQPMASSAFVQANALTVEPYDGDTMTGQDNTLTYETDGQRFYFIVESLGPNADMDTGQSAMAPRFSDAVLIMPAEWAYAVPGDYQLPFAASLKVMRVEEVQIFDDASRSYVAGARVTANNYLNEYAGVTRNFAVELNTGNGGGLFTRITGVGGVGMDGHCLLRQDPMRTYSMPVCGKEEMMKIPLGEEIIFDGWCLFSAVMYLLEIGNINPMYWQTLPLYYPPGSPSIAIEQPGFAPYGPAGSDCPYPILPKGTGLNPRHRYLPDDTPWNVTQRLAQDNGFLSVDGSINVPYYFGFRSDGQFLFAPYDIFGITSYPNFGGLLPGQPIFPKGIITDIYQTYVQPSPPQFAAPLFECEVFSSTAQMRSSVTFQGLDAFTNQLTQQTGEQSPQVKAQIGYRYPWLERNYRYGTDAYTQQAELTGLQISSVPTLTAIIKTVYLPQVYAGDIVYLEDTATLAKYFADATMESVVLRHQSSVGLADLQGIQGQQDCWSHLVLRWVGDQ